MTTRVSGAGRTTASSRTRAHPAHTHGCRNSRRPASTTDTVTAASPSPPDQPEGQATSAPGSPAPVRATAAVHRAGRPASQARPWATGIATGAAASAAKPSTVAGATAGSARRLHGTATRLTRAASTTITGAHTACAAAAAARASATRGGTPRRRRAAPQRGARVSRAPVARTDRQKPGARASQGSWSTSSTTAAARAGSRLRRRPVPMASRVIRPHAAARSTLGSGRHTITKPSVIPPPSTAVSRSGMPSRAASPRRSAREARWAGPVRRSSRTARLPPDTASRCVRSVALKASSRSGGTREVSPTTSPGSSARASGASPSVASRSPARSRPAARWRAEGDATTRGRASLPTRTTAATRSSCRVGGASRPSTLSTVDGRIPSQD